MPRRKQSRQRYRRTAAFRSSIQERLSPESSGKGFTSSPCRQEFEVFRSINVRAAALGILPLH
jgi:hypothetical protein